MSEPAGEFLNELERAVGDLNKLIAEIKAEEAPLSAEGREMLQHIATMLTEIRGRLRGPQT